MDLRCQRCKELSALLLASSVSEGKEEETAVPYRTLLVVVVGCWAKLQ